MKTIYKYPIRIVDIQTIAMPKDAQILTIQMQRNFPCVWAMVDTDNKPEDRIIEIIGTGNPIESAGSETDREYIGTFMSNEEAFVWHVFERI